MYHVSLRPDEALLMLTSSKFVWIDAGEVIVKYSADKYLYF